jgi:hypothetical protein
LPSDEERVENLALRLSDRQEIDWAHELRSCSSTETRRVLLALRAVAGRPAGMSVPDPAPRTAGNGLLWVAVLIATLAM